MASSTFDVSGKSYEQRTQLLLQVAPGKMNAVKELMLDGEIGIPFTKSCTGCLEVHTSTGVNEDGSEYFAITGFWAKVGNFDAYLATAERGPDSKFMTTLKPMLTAPPEILVTFPWGVYGDRKGKAYEERSQLKFPVAAGKMDDAIHLLHEDPTGLPFTLKMRGAMEVHCSKGANEDGSEYIAITGFWHKKGDFEAYIATPERAQDSHFMTKMKEVLSGPPTILLTSFWKQWGVRPKSPLMRVIDAINPFHRAPVRAA